MQLKHNEVKPLFFFARCPTHDRRGASPGKWEEGKGEETRGDKRRLKFCCLYKNEKSEKKKRGKEIRGDETQRVEYRVDNVRLKGLVFHLIHKSSDRKSPWPQITPVLFRFQTYFVQ